MPPRIRSASRWSACAPSLRRSVIDEGDCEVSVGTQLTCTYADDNGDTPAYVEITSIDGSQYELSVSVP